MNIDEVAKNAGGFLRSLSLSRVVLALTLAAGGVVLFALYESRDTWRESIWSSPLLLGMITAGGAIAAVGAALMSMQRRLDDRGATLYSQMRDQIEDMQRALEASAVERRAQYEQAATDRREQQAQISALVAAEARCQERLDRLISNRG